MLLFPRIRFSPRSRKTSHKPLSSLFRDALALALAAFLFLGPLGFTVNVNAQESTAGTKVPEGDYFIYYLDATGEMVCREATLLERQEMSKVNTDGLGMKPINHLNDGYDEFSKSTKAQTGDDDLPLHLTIFLRATAQLNEPQNAQAKAAFIRAAQIWEAQVKSPVTIYIDVDFGATNFGAPWGPGTLGSTSSPSLSSVPYSEVRQRLIDGASNSAETTMYNSLPANILPTDLGGVDTVSVSFSIARAIGLLDPTAPNPDDFPNTSRPRIGFNSAFTYDFDPSNGISGGTDFEAVAVHEIGHALGFTSRSGSGTPPATVTPAVWDMWRFRTGTTISSFTTAQRIMTKGPNPAPGQDQFYFVPGYLGELGLSTGGPNPPTGQTDGDGNQSSHWKNAGQNNGEYIGIMDPRIPSNTRREITLNDTNGLNTFGYNLENTNPPPPPPPAPLAPANNNFVNAIVLGGCSSSVNGTNVGATAEVGEPRHDPGNSVGGGSVWYFWQAPSTGLVTMNTTGSGTNYDTVLAVYAGDSVGALGTPIVRNDDIDPGVITSSSVEFTATAGVIYKIAVDGWGGETGTFVLNWAQTSCVQPTMQLSSTTYNVNEALSAGQSFATITLTRTNTAVAATVKYETSDSTDVNFQCNPSTGGQPTGVASRKCDYHIGSGRVRFAAGEVSKQIVLSIIDDVYIEGPENFTLTLSNPVGATLGSTTTATVTIADNDAAAAPNPIDGTQFFVRQLYVDLLSREPDVQGWNGWISRIDLCGQPGQAPPPCDRVTVGGDGFLRSGEFFDRQFFVLRLYRTGIGRILLYPEVGDLAFVSGFLSAGDLELNKQDLVAALMTKPEFAPLNALSNPSFVATLVQTANVTIDPAVISAWVAALNAGTKTRAQVYREISERPEVSARWLQEAQVVSAYYGFFTRNPDGAAYSSYLPRLQSGEINLGDLANAFINSPEYRLRFGP